MNETHTEEKKKNDILIIIILVFVCLGGLCLVGLTVFGGAAFMGVKTAFGLTTPAITTSGPAQATPSLVSATIAPEDIPSGDLLTLIDDGSITVDGIHIPQQDLLSRPPKPDFKIHNPGEKDIKVTIPCGLTLMPPVETEAKLMVFQKAEAIVPAGGSINIDLMVVSIEASKQMPTGTGDYTVGTTVEGELLTLANCLCEQDIEAQAQTDEPWYTEVLFATWSVSDDFPLSFMQGTFDIYSAYTGGTPSCMETVVPKSLSILDTCGLPAGDPRTPTTPPPATSTP